MPCRISPYPLSSLGGKERPRSRIAAIGARFNASGHGGRWCQRLIALPAAGRSARMTNEVPAVSLLEELDARQNELLDELERLNGRIERVIAEWTILRAVEERDMPARAA